MKNFLISIKLNSNWYLFSKQFEIEKNIFFNLIMTKFNGYLKFG